MVPTKKEELRDLVTQTTMETYEELTPHLVQLINETNSNPKLTIFHIPAAGVLNRKKTSSELVFSTIRDRKSVV